MVTETLRLTVPLPSAPAKLTVVASPVNRNFTTSPAAKLPIKLFDNELTSLMAKVLDVWLPEISDPWVVANIVAVLVASEAVTLALICTRYSPALQIAGERTRAVGPAVDPRLIVKGDVLEGAGGSNALGRRVVCENVIAAAKAAQLLPYPITQILQVGGGVGGTVEKSLRGVKLTALVGREESAAVG